MQVYIPENLKLFITSHWINGKCKVELEAITGIVMSHEERTKTRVYGDHTGVGSSTSIDQAFWIQLENGREECIELGNIDLHLARPGHQLTFIKATNLLNKEHYSLYVALYNHVTDKHCIYQQRDTPFTWKWRFILYKPKKKFNWLKFVIFYFAATVLLRLIVANLGLSTSDIGGLIIIGMFAFWGFAIIWALLKKTDRRFNEFENHIRKIIHDFREQLKIS
ncbi:hypothetical protein NIES2100_64290 [Calothrix sp. NIES-2100]|uniref:hypothetical protein n=1 Tax=Calothrix sp. NIES-2100 TaxID=1954172 RepID=UPI000B5FCF81|nr:hypothetical protein NIES2100_64290 [Calothrix sp. NIES-2100]